MSNNEFAKIWTLMTSLWPAAAAKKSKVDIAVWWKCLESYKMEDVSNRIITYAQRNKFFPDVADITENLLVANHDPTGEKRRNMEKMLAHLKKKAGGEE